MERRMDGGWLSDESDGERDRSIGRYTQMEPDSLTNTQTQDRLSHQTLLSHQQTPEQAHPTSEQSSQKY